MLAAVGGKNARDHTRNLMSNFDKSSSPSSCEDDSNNCYKDIVTKYRLDYKTKQEAAIDYKARGF